MHDRIYSIMPFRKKGIIDKSLGKSMEELQFEFSENHKINLHLDDKKLYFENGQWKIENLENKDISTLIEENKRLVEENNFLKVKIEVLLLMLTEKAFKIPSEVS